MADGLMARRARANLRGPVRLVTWVLAGALLVWSWAEFVGPAITADRVAASAAAGQPSAAARASGRMRPRTSYTVGGSSASGSFAARAAARSRSSRVSRADRARARQLAARRVGPNATARRDWIVATGDGR
jgi:hypothetical protein